MSILNILDKLLPDRYIDEKTRKLLLDKFGASGYWYPLLGDNKPDNMEYFEIDAFKTNFGDKKLIAIINRLGENKINEINESADDTKIDVAEIEISNSETYYCNDNVDWIIYCSHEDTVSIGGKKLLDELKTEWKDWEKYSDTWEVN